MKVAADNEEGFLLAEGFDDALIGFGTRFASHVAVYDYEKCVDVLMKRDGVTREDAVEFLEFNVTGAYVGDETPVFVRETVK